jgi:heme oxygenase
MLMRLALETRAHHAAADANRLAVMEESALDAYRAYLTLIYGFEAAVEHALMRTPGFDPRVLRARTKAGRLVQDLIALGATEPDVSRTPRCVVRPFHSAAEGYGWLYVIDRNTLLFGLIRRHLMQHLRLRHALAYLSCYGDTPGGMFRDLGELINKEAERGREAVAEIVGAANRAFWSQRAWFVSHKRRTREPTPMAS